MHLPSISHTDHINMHISKASKLSANWIF